MSSPTWSATSAERARRLSHLSPATPRTIRFGVSLVRGVAGSRHEGVPRLRPGLRRLAGADESAHHDVFQREPRSSPQQRVHRGVSESSCSPTVFTQLTSPPSRAIRGVSGFGVGARCCAWLPVFLGTISAPAARPVRPCVRRPRPWRPHESAPSRSRVSAATESSLGPGVLGAARCRTYARLWLVRLRHAEMAPRGGRPCAPRPAGRHTR